MEHGVSKRNTICGIGLLAALCAGAVSARDSTSTPVRKREKYIEYNKAVSWSSSPFDTSVHRDSGREGDQEIPLEEEKTSLSVETFSNINTLPDETLQSVLTAIVLDQAATGQMGPRRRAEPQSEKTSLLDVDIAEELSGAEKKTESGWGWLADDVQKVRENEGESGARTEQEHAEDDASAGSENEKRPQITDSLGIASRSSNTERTPAKMSGTASAQSVAAKVDDAESPGRSGTRSAAASDQLLSSWEQEMGLAEPGNREKDALPQTRKILEELTRSEIRPAESTPDSSTSSKGITTSSEKETTAVTTRSYLGGTEKTVSGGASSSGFSPYRSSYSQGISMYDRKPLSPFRQGAGTSFATESRGFDRKASIDSGTPAFNNNESLQTPASPSTSLDAFRQIHRSSGSIRPFETDLNSQR